MTEALSPVIDYSHCTTMDELNKAHQTNCIPLHEAFYDAKAPHDAWLTEAIAPAQKVYDDEPTRAAVYDELTAEFAVTSKPTTDAIQTIRDMASAEVDKKVKSFVNIRNSILTKAGYSLEGFTEMVNNLTEISEDERKAITPVIEAVRAARVKLDEKMEKLNEKTLAKINALTAKLKALQEDLQARYEAHPAEIDAAALFKATIQPLKDEYNARLQPSKDALEAAQKPFQEAYELRHAVLYSEVTPLNRKH